MCIEGARWVQTEVLEENPTADIRVYVVWERMLVTDTIRATRSGMIDDERATHYKDVARISGKWFNENYGGDKGSVAWDIAYVFGPEATWENKPSPMLGWGAAVIHQKDKLMAVLTPLLSDK